MNNFCVMHTHHKIWHHLFLLNVARSCVFTSFRPCTSRQEHRWWLKMANTWHLILNVVIYKLNGCSQTHIFRFVVLVVASLALLAALSACCELDVFADDVGLSSCLTSSADSFWPVKVDLMPATRPVSSSITCLPVYAKNVTYIYIYSEHEITCVLQN